MKTPQIHCFLDCLSLALQKGRNIEYRPLYVGVWNTPFMLDEQTITYYSEMIDPDEGLRQFEQIYGNGIIRWNESNGDKSIHLIQLKRQMSEISPNMTVIVLVDLFYLSYSYPCYQTKHFPHIVVVDHVKEEEWFIRDPFNEWEGYISQSVLNDSLSCGNMSIGITVDSSQLHEPNKKAFSNLFESQCKMTTSPLITEVDAYILKIMNNESHYTLNTLMNSIEHISIISKRWRGLDVMNSYFVEKVGLHQNLLRDKVSYLISKWEGFMLSAIRICIMKKYDSLQSLRDKLYSIGNLEMEVKHELLELYRQWNDGEGNDDGTQENTNRLCERTAKASK